MLEPQIWNDSVISESTVVNSKEATQIIYSILPTWISRPTRSKLDNRSNSTLAFRSENRHDCASIHAYASIYQEIEQRKTIKKKWLCLAEVTAKELSDQRTSCNTCCQSRALTHHCVNERYTYVILRNLSDIESLSCSTLNTSKSWSKSERMRHLLNSIV